MEKYKTNPDTEILGYSINAVFNSINFKKMKPKFEAVMQKYGYPDTTIKDDEWYPLQMVLDFYNELKDSEQLVSVGIKIFDAAQTPPEIDSIPKAIELLMAIHSMNLRNVPEEDGYRDYKFEDKKVEFVEVTSFPHDLFYGYIYSIVHRFKATGTSPVIKRTYLNQEQPDKDGAHYLITW